MILERATEEATDSKIDKEEATRASRSSAETNPSRSRRAKMARRKFQLRALEKRRVATKDRAKKDLF